MEFWWILPDFHECSCKAHTKSITTYHYNVEHDSTCSRQMRMCSRQRRMLLLNCTVLKPPLETPWTSEQRPSATWTQSATSAKLHQDQRSAIPKKSHALAMDDGGTCLIVFFLGNPHLLEGGEGCEDGTTDPNAVLPFRWSNHLDPHSGRCKSAKLLGHALTNTWQHGRTTWEHNVGEEVPTNINITLHDWLKCGVMDSHGLLPKQAWLEKNFWATKAFSVQGDDVPVRELICFSTLIRVMCWLMPDPRIVTPATKKGYSAASSTSSSSGTFSRLAAKTKHRTWAMWAKEHEVEQVLQPRRSCKRSNFS